MAAAKVEKAAPLPGLPDYLASPNAVLGDTEAQWRYGKPPDYSKTRAVWAQSKKGNHVAGSLPELVENLVKNWEVEASFKTRLADWRTVDHKNYTFAINGGPPQSGEHMLRVGTYNAIIAPNEYYSPENSDFASSHKTFKRMMPTFAWEVIEVYSGPPRVSIKWRHWGTMKNDYVGFNDKGEKVTAKAHGGIIDILGITIATVDEKVRLQAVDTYFDPLDMFRQIAPNGIVNKQAVNKKVFTESKEAALDDEVSTKTEQSRVDVTTEHSKEQSSSEVSHDAVSETSTAEGPNTSSDSAFGTTVDAPAHNSSDMRPRHAANIEGNTQIVTDSNPAHTKRPVEPEAVEQSCPVSGQESTTQATCPMTGYRSPVPSQSSESPWENVSNPSSDVDNLQGPYDSSVTGNVTKRAELGEAGRVPDLEADAGVKNEIEEHLEGPADQVHPHVKTMEMRVKPVAGDAVAADADTEETIMTHEEMSRITPSECPFLMNRE